MSDSYTLLRLETSEVQLCVPVRRWECENLDGLVSVEIDLLDGGKRFVFVPVDDLVVLHSVVMELDEVEFDRVVQLQLLRDRLAVGLRDRARVS